MELSFEIPLPHLHEFRPLEDFGFGLAHLMLGTKYTHSGTYHVAMQGCLLDNSMYEKRDEPLPTADLIAAAEVCYPCAIIAPDWMDDRRKTLNAVEELTMTLPSNDWQMQHSARYPWDIGGVVQGKDLQERVECFYIMQDRLGCDPICFPFRTPRHETIGTLLMEGAFKTTGWYHLLGLENFKELSWNPPGRWSIDTAKPFKGKLLNKLKSIRGLGRLQIHEPLTEEQRRIAAWNIAYMRKRCT